MGWSGETSREAVTESQTGDGQGSWVYQMARFSSSPLAVMHELSTEKNF